MTTTTSLFASNGNEEPSGNGYGPTNYVFDARGNVQPAYMKEQQTTFPNYPPSEASTLQTRTFLSY
jgi:hypothetical protein